MIGGRTPDKVKKVIEQLEVDHPEFKGRAKFFEMNFDTLKGAREGAERVLALVDRIDGLVNNAGRLAGAGPYELSQDGVEMVCQVKLVTDCYLNTRSTSTDRSRCTILIVTWERSNSPKFYFRYLSKLPRRTEMFESSP